MALKEKDIAIASLLYRRGALKKITTSRWNRFPAGPYSKPELDPNVTKVHEYVRD